MAFWTLAALFTLAALVVVVRPLIRGGAHALDAETARKLAALDAARDAGVLSAEEHARKREELGLVANKAAPPPTSLPMALTLAAVIPALAFTLYFQVGEPRALDPANLARSADGGDTRAPDMEKAIADLAQRLQEQPDDPEGWALLGRAYGATQRFAQARDALKKAFELMPDNLDMQAEYAESLALAREDRTIEGESLRLIDAVLARDPEHQRASWLKGIADSQAGNYTAAAERWQRLLAQLPPDAEIATTIRNQIAEARSRAGLPPLTDEPIAANAPQAPSMPATTTASGPSLTVRVDIAPELKAKVSAQDVLFVFARAPTGPRMPLAIQRLSAASLPMTVVLDDSMGMTPAMKLSSVEQVIVGARISKSGNAAAQTGDLQVLSAPLGVKTTTAPIDLIINEVVP